MKPKRTYPKKVGPYDLCQSPKYAADPLIPLVYEVGKRIWEPCSGEGILAQAFRDVGYDVIESDILTGQDFFSWTPSQYYDVIVTNPPYSMKAEWTRRCFELNVPFALLLPLEWLGTAEAQKIFLEASVNHGWFLRLILMDKRINFKMPYKGWKGSAQFPVAWYTIGLLTGPQLHYWRLDKRGVK